MLGGAATPWEASFGRALRLGVCSALDRCDGQHAYCWSLDNLCLLRERLHLYVNPARH